jgi:hypothetical protein
MLGPMVCPISAFSRGLGSVVLMLALAVGPATGCSDDVPTGSGEGSSTTGATTGTTGSGTITVGSVDDTVGSTSGGMGSTASSSSGEPGTESSGSSGGTTEGLSTTDAGSSSDGTTSGGSTTDATTSGSTTDATTAATTDPTTSGGSTDPTSGGSTTDFTSTGVMVTGATDFGSTSGDPSGTTDATTDGGSDDGDTGTMVEVPDFSGDFLLVLATPLDPTLPFQYVANFDYVPSGLGGGTVDVELQPLTLDTGSTTTPRMFFGPPLVFPAIPVTPDGTFAVPVGILNVAAETNPLFFIDAQANNVVLSVQVLDADDLCGTVTGFLVFPVASPLDGTTLAAVRVLDVMPAGLPLVFPVACP